MWMSERQSRSPNKEGTAALGTVTLQEAGVGAYLQKEHRALPVAGPGGYCWRPSLGQQVLVIKTGDQGELPCVTGALCREDGDLGPGDVKIWAGEAAVVLRGDGSVDLQGQVKYNGVPLEDRFMPKPVEDGEGGA